MSKPPKILPRIRSFVKRESRLTKKQQAAIKDSWPQCGLDFDLEAPALPTSKTDEFFNHDTARFLDIGFGSGETLSEMAELNPDKYFIGMEVHRPGVGNLLIRVQDRQLKNVKVIVHDAVEVINSSYFSPGSDTGFKFDGIYLLFADPWPKRKHHKRRIVQTDFVNQISKLLKPNGYFYIATDWDDYATHIRNVMSECNQFELESVPADDVIARPHSKYEQRGLRLGHDIHDLVYRLK